MKNLIFIPSFLQGLAMFFDEFYFHRKRGLPLWERIGHPLDTLTVLTCFAWLILMPLQPSSLLNWVGWVSFSCLWVTKDEWIHHRSCSTGEVWLHSVLFILHPICLLSVGWMAWNGGYEWFIKLQTFLLIVFMIYQFTYWNLLWKPKK